jgi:hypothetical protein
MTDAVADNEPTPEFRALTLFASAVAETFDKAGLLDTLVVRLQKAAVEASEDLSRDDPALKWVENVTMQLLRS